MTHKATDTTRAEVKALTSMGIRQEAVAEYLGIDPKTLRKHYEAELRTAKVASNLKVARLLMKQCEAGNTTALIFWLKAQAGWSEKVQIEDVTPTSRAEALRARRERAQLGR